MENFKSNSFKSKEAEQVEERKKLDKVVSGTAKTKKKSGLSKFFSSFISEDVPDIKSYIVTDVIIPTIKRAILDTVDMALNGRVSRKSGGSIASKISYRSFYDEPRSPKNDRTLMNGSGYKDVIFDSRADAEEVISHINDMIDVYGMVSVADLYDLAGISSEWTDNKYGWTNIRNAEVQRVYEGYLLKMPRALPLK